MDNFYDNARSARNEKAQRRAAPQKGDIDASGWEEPTMETGRKTGGQPMPRAYKRGGKVDGFESLKNASRTPRASGGKLLKYIGEASKDAAKSARNAEGNKVTSFGFKKASDAEKRFSDRSDAFNARSSRRQSGIDMALDKLEGKAKVPATKASGGKVHEKGCTCKACGGGAVSRETRATGGGNYDGGTRPTGDRIAKASGGHFSDKPLAAKGLTSYRAKNGAYGHVMIGAKDHDDALREAKRSNKGLEAKDLEIWNGKKYEPISERSERKSGGKVKGKTNININISTAPKPPVLPPMGAGAPPMPNGPLPTGLGIPPPAMGAGPMPRASGGRVAKATGGVTLKAGAGSGLGRLEKAEIEKRKK